MGYIKKDKDKIQAAEMRFLRTVKGCTRVDRIRNVDIRAELNIYNINNTLEENKENWKQHIDRLTETRIPKQRKENEVGTGSLA
jgi:ribosomal protein L20